MTTPNQEAQVQATETPKNNTAERNFDLIRRQLDMEKLARAEAEQRAADAERRMRQAEVVDDDADPDEPYVDYKRLDKKLAKVKITAREEAKQEVQREVQKALQQERQQMWLRNNPDFQDVMSHAERFAQQDPELAETILEMPEGFERQKLVYKNIKALGLHKKPEPVPSIQSKIDANRKGPYYQPSGVGAAPYASAGDFSQSGQKSAYDKMQELKGRLRLS